MGGYRTLAVVPMLKEDRLIGAIGIYRQEVRLFTDKQIELVSNFAKQAVIAIENTRLLNELRESLQQQTATADVLNVISRSKFDRQPVFDAIVESGLHLFSDDAVLIALPEGDLINAAAVAAHDPTRAEAIKNRFPVSLSRDYMHGIVILDRKVIDIPDGTAVPTELSTGARAFLGSGNRAITIVPLVSGEQAIGALSVLRQAPGRLSPKQFELLKTFADQAVIAIENTRLFEEVQARTRELSEALEQQSAAAEILRVISQSPTDIQPVFDAIARSAVRLCGAQFSNVFRFDGEMLHLVAHHNFTPDILELMRQLYPMRPSRDQLSGRAILAKAVVQVEDLLADPEYRQQVAVTGGWRSILAVPMLQEGRPVGVININLTEPGTFSERQIELLQTFADQAVIAIENTRLFEAEQASKRELTDLSNTRPRPRCAQGYQSVDL